MLQYRLPGMSRTTKDIDGLVRGDLDQFLVELDKALGQPWGPLTLKRQEVERIEVPNRSIKPRRFDITVSLKGETWRRVQVEISPDEGQAGTLSESFSPPSLAGFGLPSPDRIASLSMSYQIAQKIHACTDPHDPPAFVNDRARDVVDLLLLKELAETTQHPPLDEVRHAVEDVFSARAEDATAAGTTPRSWPTRAVQHPHWGASFASAAESAGQTFTFADAIGRLNDWLDLIEHA